MSRKEKLLEILANIGEDQLELIMPMIDEVVFLEERMTELKKLPFVSVHPKHKGIMRQTAAAKQYKECSQSYMNAIRILLSLLSKNDTSAIDELMNKLSEFE